MSGDEKARLATLVDAVIRARLVPRPATEDERDVLLKALHDGGLMILEAAEEVGAHRSKFLGYFFGAGNADRYIGRHVENLAGPVAAELQRVGANAAYDVRIALDRAQAAEAKAEAALSALMAVAKAPVATVETEMGDLAVTPDTVRTLAARVKELLDMEVLARIAADITNKTEEGGDGSPPPL